MLLRHVVNNSTGLEAFLCDADLVLMPPVPTPFGTPKPQSSSTLRSKTPTNPFNHARQLRRIDTYEQLALPSGEHRSFWAFCPETGIIGTRARPERAAALLYSHRGRTAAA